MMLFILSACVSIPSLSKHLSLFSAEQIIFHNFDAAFLLVHTLTYES